MRVEKKEQNVDYGFISSVLIWKSGNFGVSAMAAMTMRSHNTCILCVGNMKFTKKMRVENRPSQIVKFSTLCTNCEFYYSPYHISNFITFLPARSHIHRG